MHKEPCLKNYFSNIVLVIIYNHPHYDSVSLLRQFYQPVFPTIFFCGSWVRNQSEEKISFVDINKGIYGYECLSEAIRQNPGYDGYFYINDDVVLNYWNLVQKSFDSSFIWISNNQFGKVDLKKSRPTEWYWWVSPYGFNNCIQAVKEVKELAEKFKQHKDMFLRYLTNNNQHFYAYNGRSDILYIPRQYAMKFQEISRIFFHQKVFLEIAIPTMIRFLAPSYELRTLRGFYMPGDVRKNDSRVIDSRHFWISYLRNSKLLFFHPFKLHHAGSRNRDLSLILMKHIMIAKTNILTNC